MATIHLYTGTPASERTQRIDDLMRERWGRAMLIMPTRSAANQRLETFLLESDLPGCWDPRVLTLEDISLLILEAEGFRVHRLDELERRMLVEGVVQRLASENRLAVLGDAATSDGFVTHALRVITQLKQAAVEPAHFREVIAHRAHGSWLDSIVAAVYEGYQDALIQTRSYDRVGIFWQTEVVLKEGPPAALEGVESLLLDGFEDFTPSEFRLVKTLAGHVSEMVFGIDGDVVEPSRQDLFIIPRATHEKIAGEFEHVQSTTFAAPSAKSHSEYLAGEIFWRQRPTPAPDLRPNVAVVPCPDLRQEVEHAGRKIKTLILDRSVPCDRIAILFRDLRDSASTVRAVFDEFGIPVAVERPVPLEESSLACFVMNLFEACQTWSRHSVLDVITAPWFAEGGVPREQVDLFPVLARRAGIIEGQQEWMDGVRRCRGQFDNDDAKSGTGVKRLPHMREAFDSLLTRLEHLAEVARLLPARARPAAFVAGVEDSLESCNAIRALTNGTAGPILEREQAAWNALKLTLGRVDAWHQRQGGNRSIDRDDFVRVLRGTFRATALEQPPIPGAVVCKSADDLRHDAYDYVFLCGMNEGEFPRPPSVGAIYTDTDIADFAAHRIELDDKHRHAAREMLAFHHAVRAARTHLTLTWHAQSRDGRAASPSPFLTDTLELLEPLGVKSETPATPLFAPEPGSVGSMRDVRNSAFLRSKPLRELYRKEFQHVTDALSIETARQDASLLGVYDGMLADPGLVDAVAAHFGSGHLFSVNQIESYAGCPFRFFMTRVLGVDPEEEPGAEFDPLVRGRILHEVLHAFHKEYLGRPVADIPETEANEAIVRHLDDVFARRAYQSINTPPKAAHAERGRMAVLLQRYLAIAREKDTDAWQPRHFEVSFGNVHGRSEDSLSKTEPYELATNEGPIRFTGRIDRIDTSEQGARIIDYKTSVYARQAEIEAGVSVQLPVYALALEEYLMPGTPCADARFLQIGGKGHLAGLETKGSPWSERKEHIRDHIARHVSAIRAGHFPPVPYRDMCRECRDHRACRFDTSRIERKTETAE